MLTQIYAVSRPDEARSISTIGVDHIGVVVGRGQFRRELPLAPAAEVAAAIVKPSKFAALFLSDDMELIVVWSRELRPAIVHLGAGADRLSPADVAKLKDKLPDSRIMRSIAVSGEESVVLAQSYDGIADFLLLDSGGPSDRKVGGLGVTHDWRISQRIVESARIPVILAGGLGPDNVAAAIRAVRPAGVDSKTKTDRGGSDEKDIDCVRRFHEAAQAGR